MSNRPFRPSKRLGQNFLADPRIAHAIVEAAELEPGDTVLEIGPGQGALTRHLAERAGHVVAVEVDHRLEADLGKLQAEHPNVRVVWADFLQTTFSELGVEEPRAKVVANIPYYITTPILLKLLHATELERAPLAEASPRPERIILMIQAEVADRLRAEPGSKAYGSLSVIAQYAATVSRVVKVPRTAFRPRPEVDSEVVMLVPREAPPVDVADPVQFFRVVRASFGQRRKTLRNALAAASFGKETLDAAFMATGIDGGRRGETLSLAEFAALARAIAQA